MSEKEVKRLDKVTQSMMKSYVAYLAGEECGYVFIAKYFDDFRTKPTPVQNMGTWFEFMLTGALPKDGLVPQPEKTLAGKLTAPYEKLTRQMANFNALADFYKIKWEPGSAGVTHSAESLSGTYDILGTVQGRPAIVDIKTTGLLYDSWNAFGWAAEKLADRELLTIQAVHYTATEFLRTGEVPDFYFAVFSNTNEVDHEIFKMHISPDRIAYHIQEAKDYLELINQDFEAGSIVAIPEYKRCRKCPLRDRCDKVTDVPSLTEIYLQ